MNPLIVWAIRASLLLLNIKEGPLDDRLRAEVDDLRDQLTPMLPPPPNGEAWTSEDLQALVNELREVNDDIRENHGE